MCAVRGVGALLIDAPRARAPAQLVPADARVIRPVDVDGVVREERLIATEVPILQSVHQPVGESIQRSAGLGLGNAVPVVVAHVRVEGNGCQRLLPRKCRGERVRPGRVELPDLELVGRVAPGVVIDGGEGVGGAGRGKGGAIEVRGQHHADVRVNRI